MTVTVADVVPAKGPPTTSTVMVCCPGGSGRSIATYGRGDERRFLWIDAEDVVFGQLRAALRGYGDEPFACDVDWRAPVDGDEDGVKLEERVQAVDGALPLRLLADGEEWRRLHLVAEHLPAEQEHRRAWLDGALRRHLAFGSRPEDEDVASVSGREAALTRPGQWVLRGRKFEQQSRLLADQLPPPSSPRVVWPREPVARPWAPRPRRPGSRQR